MKKVWKIIVGIMMLALLIATNPGKDAHWTEIEAYFEAQAAKESKQASWLERFGFWLLKDSMKDSIYNALYLRNYGVCSTACIEGNVVTFGILGLVFVVD